MSQDQDIYRLLLDSHDGAPQKTFRNEFVQVLTRQAKSCNVDRIVSDAFLHLYAEVILVLLEELLRTGIISREADELLAEYCSFVYSGWKGLAGQ